VTPIYNFECFEYLVKFSFFFTLQFQNPKLSFHYDAGKNEMNWTMLKDDLWKFQKWNKEKLSKIENEELEITFTQKCRNLLCDESVLRLKSLLI
jgi:hypothetical protein